MTTDAATPTRVSTTITLPLTEAQAQAVAAAAIAFGVDSWELGVHILAFMLQENRIKKARDAKGTTDA